jgi:imidazolonepropionase-like amidohydrolase
MGRIVFHGGRVFDGTGAGLAEADVVVEDGRFAEVGAGLDGDEGVDCSGKTLLPGLFDTHVHLVSRYEEFDEVRVLHEPFTAPFYRVAENMRRTLACGITTVRDAAGADAGMRLAVEEGSLVGPRMQISVTMLSMTGGHNDPWLPSGATGAWGQPYPGMPSGVCDGVDGVAAKVREVVRAGADVIKIASSGGFLSPADDPSQPNFSEAEVEAIVRTAADLGRWVMSHAHGAEGIKRAVRAGVRSIDHGTYLDDEAIELMLGPPAIPPTRSRRTRRSGRRSERSCASWVVRSWTRSAAPPRPGSRSRWAPTARSPRTGRTSGSSS